jgi:glycosyltransferase involved in cell wall biosynthesis
MAMEKAVLAPRVAPIVKVLEEGVDGFTFEAGNREQLRARLAMLVQDATIRQQLGRNARHRVLAQHLWRHNVEKIIGIYENTRSPQV